MQYLFRATCRIDCIVSNGWVPATSAHGSDPVKIASPDLCRVSDRLPVVVRSPDS
jgi:hypothetical protein